MLVLLVKDTFNILTDLLTQAFPLALSLLAMPSDFVLNGLKRANRLQPAFFIFPFLGLIGRILKLSLCRLGS